MKVSTKINLVFLLFLIAVTGVQIGLRYNMNQRLTVLLSVSLTLTAIGVMWFFTYRVVTVSLNKLMEVGRRWSKGDLTARVDLTNR